MKKLEKMVTERHAVLSKKDKKEFEDAIRHLKFKHKTDVQTFRRNLKDRESLSKKTHEERLRREKNAFSKKIVELKRNHQITLQNTRDIYERQALVSQKEQEKAVNNQLNEIMQKYASLASNYQKEIEKIRKMQEEHEGVVRKKEAEIVRLNIELAKSNSDLQIRKLVVQIGERNASIEQLQRRIRELESILESSNLQQHPSTSNSSASDYKDMDRNDTTEIAQDNIAVSQRHKDLRDEFIAAVTAITREHKRSGENDENREMPARNSDNINSVERQGTSDSPSKTGKLRGLFS